MNSIVSKINNTELKSENSGNFFLNKVISPFKKMEKAIRKINNFEQYVYKMSENNIKNRIQELIKIYKIENSFKNILYESLALVREASRRNLGLRPFDSQIMGALILHEGKICEMKTGEGKTLVAALALAVNALTLKGAHLITVNDYLAKRDKRIMSKIYNYLGLSVGLIYSNMTIKERKKHYLADITYVTNSQLAFDYLKDNMEYFVDKRVLREVNYCIIDEVDSILIDEGKTPLIISGEAEISILKCIEAEEIIKYLQYKSHYDVDEKTKAIIFETKGIRKIQKILNSSNLYDEKDPWIPFIENALKAKIFYTKNIDYIIENKNISIVDKFTGRIMSDRRWSDGLHEAIEAKENLLINASTETLASITYQNFFLSYKKYAGMTGTAETEEAEFERLYNLEVKFVPPNKKMTRKDLNDIIFLNEFSKWEVVGKEIQKIHTQGRPILVGTTSIKNSMVISEILKNKNIKHRVLNAKPENLKFESEIIAEAGELGAVTVSTNIAGRGTDILLGGNSYYRTKRQIFSFLNEIKNQKLLFLKKNQITNVKKLNLKMLVNLLFAKELELRIILKKNIRNSKNKDLSLKNFFKILKILRILKEEKINSIVMNIIENGFYNETNEIEILLKSIYQYFNFKNKKNCEVEKRLVKKLGGLYVIATERHESRRIDNQLRGRAGRQGNPGKTIIFNSLDDTLLKLFATKELKKFFDDETKTSEDTNPADFLNPLLEKTQIGIEDYYYNIRKNGFKYEKRINFDRLVIYNARKKILNKKDIKNEIFLFSNDLINTTIKKLKNAKSESDFKKLENEIFSVFNLSSSPINYKECEIFPINKVQNIFKKEFRLLYVLKRQEIKVLKNDKIQSIQKTILLKKINDGWKQYLQKIELLREIIGLRSYGQLEPLAEYEKEGFKLFLEIISEIQYNLLEKLLSLNITK